MPRLAIENYLSKTTAFAEVDIDVSTWMVHANTKFATNALLCYTNTICIAP